MPGGNSYRQWYAMRQRLQNAGRWQGNAPSHTVPDQEEGEPAPKTPRLDDSPETPESLPELEKSPTAEGTQ
nr:hypothetical protein [Psittaciform chaphamaparvovirus 6]